MQKAFNNKLIVITSNSFPFVRLKWIDLCCFSSRLCVYIFIAFAFAFWIWCLVWESWIHKKTTTTKQQQQKRHLMHKWMVIHWFANRIIDIICTYKTSNNKKEENHQPITNTLFHLTFVCLFAYMYNCFLSPSFCCILLG